jgi:hypothetical protein
VKHTVDSYLAELEERLSPLSEEKRTEIIREYRSHLEAAAAERVPERVSLAALKSPTRLSDSILRTHGVFAQAEKWQVRWLGFYCLVIGGLAAYVVELQTRTQGGIRLQPISLCPFLLILFGLGCLPYYVSCLQARRVLWKPFVVASVVCTSMVGIGIWGLASYQARSLTAPYSVANWSKVDPSELADLHDAIVSIASSGNLLAVDEFKYYYGLSGTKLRRGSRLVLPAPISGGYLVPNSSANLDHPIKFSVTHDAKNAAMIWSENKDRLLLFARNAQGIPASYARGKTVLSLGGAAFSQGTLAFSGLFLVPLACISFACSRYRPIVRRRRGVA